MLKQKLITAAFLGLALGMTEPEAKRVGGGRTSGATRPAATKPAPKDDKATQKMEEPATGSASINIRVPRVTPQTSGQSPAQTGPVLVPAAAATAAAVAATAATAAAAPELDAEARRKQNEERLARAAEEEARRRAIEEKRAAAIAAYEQEEEQRQNQRLKEKQARDAQRAKAVHESQCQFKPVMSDDDMARCRSVYK
jgi:hypothetical protein